MAKVNSLQIFDSKRKSLILLVLISIITYGQTIFFKFTQYDDDSLILKKLDFLKSISNISSLFTQPYLDYYYRPMVMLSYMLETQVAGGAPALYHITNVLIHIFTVCLLYLILRKFQQQPVPAFAGAALFAVLPLTTQAVAWIPGRNDSLLAFFVLASFYMFLQYQEQKDSKLLLGHFVLFFLALLTKEIALLFPLLILFYVNYDTKKKQSPATMMIGWGVSILLWFFLRSRALEHATYQGSAVSFSALAANIRTIPELLGKALLPLNLSAYAVYSVLSTVLGFVVLFVLFILIVQKKDTIDKKIIMIGILWFVLFLLPALAVQIQNVDHRFNYLENRAYLPLIGLVFIFIELVRAWGISLSRQELTIGGVILVFFATLTIVHSRNFKDAKQTWTHITTVSPKTPEAFFILGTVYEDSSDFQQAAVHYEKATKLDSVNVGYHNNLGSVYAKMGNFQQASREFLTSISIDSLSPYPYHNLGSICYLSNKLPQAEYYWRRAVELNPEISDPYIKLIRLYLLERRTEEALYYAQLLKEKGTDLVGQVMQAIQQRQTDTTKQR